MSKKSAATTEERSLTDLKPDQRNPNAHTDKGRALLRSSLKRLGAGRSIVLDKHGRIIAGNATAAEAAESGIDGVIVVKSDGKKLIAVQRDDLDLDKDPKAREMSIADNAIADADLQWDPKILRELKDSDVDLEAAGLSEADLKRILGDAEDEDEDVPRIKGPKSPTLFIRLTKKERAAIDKAASAKGMDAGTWAKDQLVKAAK
jgi:hypothetical protein